MCGTRPGLSSLVVLGLAGCTWGDAPPTLPADLLYARDVDGRMQTWRAPRDGEPAVFATGPGWVVPGPPDPRGELALLLRHDTPAAPPPGHVVALQPYDGDRPRLISPKVEMLSPPVWTPEGDGVVFGARIGTVSDAFRADRDGGFPERLTQVPSGAFTPHAGPDGVVVVGASLHGNAEVYLRDVQGSLDRLTLDPDDDVAPRLSPDGDFVAWRSWRGAPHVAVAAADGTGRVDVDLPGPAVEHVWHPDGDRLAVVVRTPDGTDIHVVTRRGASLAVLGADGGDDAFPAWHPAGGWIAWARATTTDEDIWIAQADGTAARAAVATSARETLPSWVP